MEADEYPRPQSPICLINKYIGVCSNQVCRAMQIFWKIVTSRSSLHSHLQLSMINQLIWLFCQNLRYSVIICTTTTRGTGSVLKHVCIGNFDFHCQGPEFISLLTMPVSMVSSKASSSSETSSLVLIWRQILCSDHVQGFSVQRG